MEPYSYKPLVLERNEIRVFKFVDSPTSDTALIHCSLENVSLDDHLPEFSQFLETNGLDWGPAATRWWVEAAQAQTTTVLTTTASELPFARWRLDGDGKLDLDSFGVDRSSLPKRYEEPHLAFNDFCPQVPGIPPTVYRDADLIRLPHRFAWGDFEALSYCWESDVRDQTVIVDGRPLAIATSLEAFLRRLRLLPEAQAGMRFWADGICIWQDNTLEKNHQVKLMKRIYTQAYSVVVWLGPHDGDADTAMKVLAQVAIVKLQETVYTGDNWTSGPPSSFWEEDSLKSWLDGVHLPSLVEVLSRDYWKRMWIIQELALNQYLTVFLYGDLQLSRFIVRSAARFCTTYCVKVHRSLESNATSSTVADLWQLGYNINALLAVPEHPYLPELEQILDLARKSRVKESQDKVYGMLGLLPLPLVECNTPDYSLDPIDVYRRFANSLLIQYGGCKLDTVLSWCSFWSENKGPSWVPNWTQGFNRNHMQWFRKREAAKQTASKIGISSDGRILTCTGLIVDSIQSTSWAAHESLPFRTQQVYTSTMNIQTTGFGKYIDFQELKSAVARTLAHDHPGIAKACSVLDIYWIDWNDIRDVNPENEQLGDLWYGLRNIIAYEGSNSYYRWEAFDRFRHTNANFEIFGYQLRDFFPNMREYVRPMLFWKNPTLWEYPKILCYRRELIEGHRWNMSLSALALVGRRLVTTDQGYLGLAAEAIQEGDVVAILCGCSFPVVLRRVGNSFVYIGECYVDGLMDGEAIDAAERGEHEFVTIDIV